MTWSVHLAKVRGRYALLLPTLFVFSAVASAEACKGSKVPRAELRRYDAQVTLCSWASGALRTVGARVTKHTDETLARSVM